MELFTVAFVLLFEYLGHELMGGMSSAYLILHAYEKSFV